MSTKFTRKSPATRKSPQGSFDLPDSRSLQLVLAMSAFQDQLVTWLVDKLHRDGFVGLTGSQLEFLGALDCGPNYAANLARALGVTRQAIHKTVRELAQKGWLRVEADEIKGNQKVINFTIEGERLMAQARQHFASLDEALEAEFGEETLEKITAFLQFRP